MPERGRTPALAAITLAVIVAACGAPTVASSRPGVSPSGAIGFPATSVPATDPPPAQGSSSATVVDPSLLSVLPAQVAGIAIAPAPDAAAGMIADPGLANAASAIAVGVAATTSATGDDFATVAVVRLRPGIYSEPFFTEWRQSYDSAACARAGGVAGHRQQVIGAHTVDVTLCTGGARTLHVHLAGDRLVSITSVGGRGFGDLVMAGLRE